MKYFILLVMIFSLTLPFSVCAESVDLGGNYYYQEVKIKKRNIASGPESVDAIEPAPEMEYEHQETDRSVASDVEQDPSTTGVKYWRFQP